MSANRILAGRVHAALRASRARFQAAACCRISLPRSALIVCMVAGYIASSSVAGLYGPVCEPAIWPVTPTTNQDRPDGHLREPKYRDIGTPGPADDRLQVVSRADRRDCVCWAQGTANLA
jgi:hypothetical protein